MHKQPVLCEGDRVGTGAYGDVFVCGDGLVAKLFRRKPLDPTGMAVRAIFRAEVAAFELCHSSEALSPYLASFHGTAEVEDVVRLDGSSGGDRYWLDCCYVLEHFTCEHCGLFGLPDDELATAYQLLEDLSNAGIQYCSDAVAFRLAPGRFKLADVATYDAAAVYADLLFDATGRLVE